MATSPDYVEFVCEQIKDVGTVRYRKMFGEYMVYVDDRPVLLVCDNMVYVKIRDEISGLMQGAETGRPYEGAKEHYLLDVENGQLAKSVTSILTAVTPVPKQKKKIKK